MTRSLAKTLGQIKHQKMNYESLENTCKLLEQISNKLEKDSEEYKALELSSAALIYIKMNKKEKDFEDFISEMNKPLSKEQLDHLRDLGINPKLF